MHRNYRTFGWLLAGCLALAGCSGGSKLNTVKVKGKVTYNGEPLAGATVNFLNQDPKGKPAGGKTNEQGEYTLTTMETLAKVVEGVLPGEYKVAIVKRKKTAAQEAQEKYGQLTPEEIEKLPQEDKMKMGMSQMAGGMQAAQGQTESGSEIPEHYASTTDSGLSASVKAGQKDPINFDLKD